MDTPQDISSQIVQIICESPGKILLGVQLGAKIRKKVSDFSPNSYQCKNLRHFISVYVPDVAEIGKAGSDIRYTVIEKPSAPADVIVQQDNTSDSLSPERSRLPIYLAGWKAFSNPSDPYIVAINRTTAVVRTLRTDSNISEPWLAIPKPSAEFHKEIARDFASALAEPMKTTLGGLLYDPKWYVRFSGIASKNGLGADWNTFRREKLIAKFHETLRAVGAPDPVSKFKFAVQETPPQSNILTAPHPGEAASPNEDHEFRSLVLKVVAELSVSELRLLKLPVGVIFDVLKK